MLNKFTSREIRFLIAAVVVSLLILSTSLGAPVIAAWLRAENLLGFVFIFAFVLTLVSLGALAWDAKIGKVEIGIILSILAVFVFAAVRMNIPEERSHLVEYAIVSALFFEALISRQPLMTIIKAATFAVIIASFVGLLDEMLQYLVPGRVFDMRDLLFNVGAAIGGAALVSVIANARLKSD
ncbi:VanZ family protein [Gracilimonas sp. BCB1]|uniref:VanZ family protein n=1 Tax=Gracilimonas sp. BCB1 TaxID=3152362 RepID=UPI0032D8F9C3